MVPIDSNRLLYDLRNSFTESHFFADDYESDPSHEYADIEIVIIISVSRGGRDKLTVRLTIRQLSLSAILLNAI